MSIKQEDVETGDLITISGKDFTYEQLDELWDKMERKDCENTFIVKYDVIYNDKIEYIKQLNEFETFEEAQCFRLAFLQVFIKTDKYYNAINRVGGKISLDITSVYADPVDPSIRLELIWRMLLELKLLDHGTGPRITSHLQRERSFKDVHSTPCEIKQQTAIQHGVVPPVPRKISGYAPLKRTTLVVEDSDPSDSDYSDSEDETHDKNKDEESSEEEEEEEPVMRYLNVNRTDLVYDYVQPDEEEEEKTQQKPEDDKPKKSKTKESTKTKETKESTKTEEKDLETKEGVTEVRYSKKMSKRELVALFEPYTEEKSKKKLNRLTKVQLLGLCKKFGCTEE